MERLILYLSLMVLLNLTGISSLKGVDKMERVALYSHSSVWVATSGGKFCLGGRLEPLIFGHNPQYINHEDNYIAPYEQFHYKDMI